VDSHSIGKGLIAGGLFLAALGAVLYVSPKIPWLGRLPGDFSIQRQNVRFYFPLATCLVVSLILSVLLRLFKK